MKILEFFQIIRPNPVVTTKREIRVSLTQKGQVTSEPKILFVLDAIDTRKPLTAIFFKNGATSGAVVGASAIDGGRAILAYDYAEPVNIAARSVVIDQDIVLNIDLNDGSGGGAAGEPALTAAMVRVDKLPALRELVAIEKTTTGEWRMAGNQHLQMGDLEMQVTGGQVFAIGLDDYGIPYQADLLVTEGQRIRPSDMQGWLYLITQDGQLPTREPEWWPAQGENPPRQLGTARAQAVRYYRPQALGPIKYELK